MPGTSAQVGASFSWSCSKPFVLSRGSDRRCWRERRNLTGQLFVSKSLPVYLMSPPVADLTRNTPSVRSREVLDSLADLSGRKLADPGDRWVIWDRWADLTLGQVSSAFRSF